MAASVEGEMPVNMRTEDNDVAMQIDNNIVEQLPDGFTRASGGPCALLEDLPFVELATRDIALQQAVNRSLNLYCGNLGLPPKGIPASTEQRIRRKILDEYAFLPNMETPSTIDTSDTHTGDNKDKATPLSKMIEDVTTATLANERGGTEATQALQLYKSVMTPAQSGQEQIVNARPSGASSDVLSHLVIRKNPNTTKATWHPPWKLMRVISGHQGWVRALAVEPGNEWFVSAGADRLIKVWDLATGTLKLSLTGHVSTIRGLVVSPRHPYLFSCAEDHRIKCWDLEYNKVIRDYHGHLSGVYCMTLHPSIDVLATGGRDAVVRVWDIRTKQAVHVLSGHTGTVMSIVSQNSEPQLVSGSMDKMIRCWDLAAGKTSVVLTNHKKSIRSLAMHPHEYTFASGAADNVKVWSCPEGRFERNIDPPNTILNALSIKTNGNPEDSVLVGGADQGYLSFWDWKSGYKFQSIESTPQPGSMASENGIFAMTFDQSETRLLTGECDKTIKIWKEDEDATPQSHPIDRNWRPKDASRF